MYTMANPVDKQLSPLFTLGLLYTLKIIRGHWRKSSATVTYPSPRKLIKNLHVTFGVSSIFIAKILTFKQTDRWIDRQRDRSQSTRLVNLRKERIYFVGYATPPSACYIHSYLQS